MFDILAFKYSVLVRFESHLNVTVRSKCGCTNFPGGQKLEEHGVCQSRPT